MSHTEQESPTEALKRHFAQRVNNQARALANRWQMVSDQPLTCELIEDLSQDVQKLIHQATRFEAHAQLERAKHLNEFLQKADSALQSGAPVDTKTIGQLIEELSQMSLRRQDQGDSKPTLPTKLPVLLVMPNEAALKITEQLNHFGIENQIAKDPAHFEHLVQQFPPCSIIVDIHFASEQYGDGYGLALIKNWSASEPKPNIPIVFMTQEDSASLELRLEASRTGGKHFFIKPNAAQLIRAVERYYSNLPEDPYKVLVVDDSKSQALFCDKSLKAAGMDTMVVTDPMQVLTAIESFSPEIVVMDMYMPGCTGTELAAVIRQQTEYVRIPIVFLSGEEDINIQLNAMRQGGDDFLTKPIDPDHLAARVLNRGHRSRELTNLIVRDSLTGLYNHTHILDRLNQACRQAKENNTSLCFAMVDIDFFKKINDNYGHPVGDKVISALSLFLKQRLRRTDSVGRYGGEEFAVILPGTKGKDALHFLNDMREVFSQLEHSAGDTDFKVSFSCGVCEFTGDNADHIIEQADEALYEAKRQGRNNVQLYVED